jgi:hypothetical protein
MLRTFELEETTVNDAVEPSRVTALLARVIETGIAVLNTFELLKIMAIP